MQGQECVEIGSPEKENSLGGAVHCAATGHTLGTRRRPVPPQALHDRLMPYWLSRISRAPWQTGQGVLASGGVAVAASAWAAVGISAGTTAGGGVAGTAVETSALSPADE